MVAEGKKCCSSLCKWEKSTQSLTGISRVTQMLSDRSKTQSLLWWLLNSPALTVMQGSYYSYNTRCRTPRRQDSEHVCEEESGLASVTWRDSPQMPGGRRKWAEHQRSFLLAFSQRMQCDHDDQLHHALASMTSPPQWTVFANCEPKKMIFLKLFKRYECAYVNACVSVCRAHAFIESSRGFKISWQWNYSWLWVLGIQFRLSVTVVCACYWALVPALGVAFSRYFVMEYKHGCLHNFKVI